MVKKKLEIKKKSKKIYYYNNNKIWPLNKTFKKI